MEWDTLHTVITVITVSGPFVKNTAVSNLKEIDEINTQKF